MKVKIGDIIIEHKDGEYIAYDDKSNIVFKLFSDADLIVWRDEDALDNRFNALTKNCKI